MVYPVSILNKGATSMKYLYFILTMKTLFPNKDDWFAKHGTAGCQPRVLFYRVLCNNIGIMKLKVLIFGTHFLWTQYYPKLGENKELNYKIIKI